MSEVKLEQYSDGKTFEGDKRTYMPYILTWTCTKCGAENEMDFGNEYISYPPLGVPFDYEYLFCGECDHEDVPIKLRISLELIAVVTKPREGGE